MLQGAIKFCNKYIIECHDKFGNLKWREEIFNTVVTGGLNHVLNSEFKGGTQVTSWYVGLKGTGAIAAADTLASHASWTEVTAYTGNRQALTLGTVASGSVDNSASKAVFAMNGPYTAAGAFVASVNTGTSGTLYGAADFSSARSGDNGDTLTVQINLSAITQ